MKIEVFASLKDHFDKEFLIEEALASIKELKEHFQKINPDSSGILAACRFAISEEFVSDDYLINENDHILVIPPSSGG